MVVVPVVLVVGLGLLVGAFVVPVGAVLDDLGLLFRVGLGFCWYFLRGVVFGFFPVYLLALFFLSMWGFVFLACFN